MELAVFGYKRAREFVRRMAFYRGEVEGAHPAYPKGSPAAANSTPVPVPIDAPDIQYTAEDDAAIRTHIRQNG